MALVLLLAGCGQTVPEPTVADEAPPALDAEPAAIEVEPTPGASDPPPAPPSEGTWTAGIVDVEKSLAGVGTAVDARAASHPDFDRFVVEFEGDALPSYHIEYVDRPVRQCGSGNPMEVAGDGWLLIRLQPASAHTEEGQPTIADRSTEPNLQVIVQATLICDFEAQVEWVLGVRSPNLYRVTELVRPARLVIDVRRG